MATKIPLRFIVLFWLLQQALYSIDGGKTSERGISQLYTEAFIE
jgi:hypothetical protein